MYTYSIEHTVQERGLRKMNAFNSKKIEEKGLYNNS
jgi:hypothetical protein